jgi:hypothetical protein
MTSDKDIAPNADAADLQQTADQIFFLVGTSRSGSTLLQSMLNMHSRITIPPETHFFHYFDWSEELQKDRDIDEIQSMVTQWYASKTRMRDLELPLDWVRAKVDELEITSLIDLFCLHLTGYREERDKQVAGEKTPRHIRHVETILEQFPKARIVALFRDPRATANSEINAQFGSPSVGVTTRRWREYVRLHDQYKQSLDANTYMMIQYRDLINEPERTLRRVVQHLGFEYEDAMLQYHQRSESEQGFAPGEMDWKNETLEPLKSNKNEKWKQQLQPWQVSLIEHTAGDWLEKMMYEPVSTPLSTVETVWYQWLDWTRAAKATISGSRDEGYQKLG